MGPRYIVKIVYTKNYNLPHSIGPESIVTLVVKYRKIKEDN